MRELSVSTDSKIVLLVLDGLGGLPDENRQTELEAADTPNFDRLAAASDLGLSVPLGSQFGVSPGSGPGHLALFGYNPIEHQVGRGVLSALGVGLNLGEEDLAARLNFATKDSSGKISDRRAGRIASEKAAPLVDLLNEQVRLTGADVTVMHEKEYRGVVVFRGGGLSGALTDTDPQRVGLAPPAVDVTDSSPAAQRSAALANEFVREAEETLRDQSPANTVLLRGFGKLPEIPGFEETYRLRSAAIATYPMYRGLAKLAGMSVLETGNDFASELRTVKNNWDDYDFFFIHVKAPDAAGEDGDPARKSAVIEEVDALLPGLLGLGPDALAVTGDHATPAKLKGHSWHGVPLLLHSPYTTPTADSFGERTCAGGVLGTFPAERIMGLLMGHALKLNRYGA